MVIDIVQYLNQFIQRSIYSAFHFNSFVIGIRHAGFVYLDPFFVVDQGPVTLAKNRYTQKQPEQQEENICTYLFHLCVC